MTNESDENSIRENVQFWATIIQNSKRVVVCHPDIESRLVTQLQVAGLAGLYDVQPNPWCPPGTAYVIDEQAVKAGIREAIQRAIHRQTRGQ